MMSRKGPATTGKNRTGTVNGDRGNEVLSQEAVRLFKTQDLGYVRTMRNKALKEVQVLEMRAKGIRGEGKKVVFVDDEVEQRRRAGEVEVEEDDIDMDDEDKEEETKISIEEKNRQKLQQKETDKLEGRLEVARERLKALTQAEEALDLQRAKMAKSPTVGGVSKQGVKFKARERKR
jgi:U3 small nucleolar RNA-associated protein 11